MPAIRDYSFEYTTATAATVTLTLPDYEVGDVLLAIIAPDTQTAETWTGTAGYTQIFNQAGAGATPSGLAAFFKVVTSSAETNPTFTRSAIETYSTALISIRNVNTSSVVNTFAATGQAGAFRYAMPTASLTSGNCLLVYASSNGVVSVPSIIEGPVISLFGNDGSTESLGVGWTFQTLTGSTYTNVTCSHTVTTAGGVKAVIALNSPTTGSLIIPTYCAADSSSYVDIINGVTAFNGNSAFAADITTYFGATLNGRTLRNGSVSALADYGINSYHSVGKLVPGNSPIINDWYGATLKPVGANRPVLANKNILAHTIPLNPTQLQRTRNINASGSNGIAFGLCTAANTAYKVWHVHGTNAIFGEKRTPLIVHPSASKGLLRSVGTLTGSVVALGFAESVAFPSTNNLPDWEFCQIWELDTTIVAGGTSIEPISVPGIIKAISDGHERLSALQQGSTQMTTYAPFQIGNGGRNEVYLDLNSTAIEFPEQYNLDTRNVNYCSIDNVVGITYHAGPTDTIIHKDSIISSKSKYHWRINPNSSTAATYDFSGLSIIGSGDVELLNGITFNSMTFNSCSMIQASGTITNCTFIRSSDSASLEANISSMNNISNCIFQNNLRGIQLIQTGTYEFNNITFISNSFDVYSPLTTGSITINVNGGTTPTTASAGVTFTLVNTQQLNITSLVSGTEIHVYRASDLFEFAGTESSDTTFTYNYNADNTEIFITLIKPGYKWVRYNNLFFDGDGIDIIATQQIDLGYSNPPGP